MNFSLILPDNFAYLNDIFIYPLSIFCSVSLNNYIIPCSSPLVNTFVQKK
nr:MAG TPA: hypothetical protein [Caudoviricetes sp.]